MMEWDRLIGSEICRVKRAAALLGVSEDDLMAVGRSSALSAEESWDDEGGRSLSSWVWLQVHYDVGKVLERHGRMLAHDTEYEAATDDELPPDPDTVVLVGRALTYLQAHLHSLEWTLLWLRHAEGWTSSEIADELGITTVAARIKLHRAARKSETLLRSAGIVE